MKGGVTSTSMSGSTSSPPLVSSSVSGAIAGSVASVSNPESVVLMVAASESGACF
jgi:hypothetical protein